MAKISAALRSPKKRPISTLVSSSQGIEGGNRGHSLLNGKRVGVSGEGEIGRGGSKSMRRGGGMGGIERGGVLGRAAVLRRCRH